MTINLENLHLAHGGHETRDDGLCLLEAVAWFAADRLITDGQVPS